MGYRHILLTGVEFNNQGAHLMMQAAAEQVRERFGAIPVVARSNGNRDQKNFGGVAALAPMTVYRRMGHLGRPNVAARLSNFTGFVFPSEIDAVFDASGFAYADEWQHEPLGKRADYLEYWASNDVPVYMLPQAFGPFVHTAEPSRRAIMASRIVMARDNESRLHVEQLIPGASTQVLQFPDFTGAVQGVFPKSHEAYRGMVPIIPNWNIVKRASNDSEKSAYIRNLAALAEHISKRGLRPYGLSHEGDKDVHVLEAVRKELDPSKEFPIVSGLNGIALKGLISSAPLIVSGRFHAIVSALTSGTPAVIHGWSHKYKHLADEFSSSEMMVDPVGSTESNIAAIDRILADPIFAQTISEAAMSVKAKIEEMWEAVHMDFISVKSPVKS